MLPKVLWSLKRKLTRRRCMAPDDVVAEEDRENCHGVPATRHVISMAPVYMCPKCDIVCMYGDNPSVRTSLEYPEYRQVSCGNDRATTNRQVHCQANGDTWRSVIVREVPLLCRLDEVDNFDTTLQITDGSHQVIQTNYATNKYAIPNCLQPSGDGRVSGTDRYAHTDTSRVESTLDTDGERMIADDVISASGRIPTICMKRESGSPGEWLGAPRRPSPLETDTMSSGDCLGLDNGRPGGKGSGQGVPPRHRGWTQSDPSCKSHPAGNNAMTLDEIPDEMFMHICRYIAKDATLAALKSTCWRFHRLLEDSTFWRWKRLAIHGVIKVGLVSRALNNAPCLRELDLRDCVQITDEFLYHVMCRFPTIDDVDLTGCVLLTDKCMSVMRHSLLRLTSLSISRCHLVTCYALVQLVKRHGATMRHLDLSNSIGLLKDRYRIAEIADHLPNLTSLSVNWSSRYDRTLILDADLSRVALLCRKLTRLDSGSSHVHASSIDSLATHCGDLRRLNLANCFVRQPDLALLGCRLQRLEHVNLSGCNSLSDSALHPSHHQLYRLQHLNLSCCFYLENETCNEILVKLTQLREYMIRECFRVTEKGLMAALFHPTLFYLDVSGTAVNLRYVAAIRGSALTGCLTVIAERCPPTARQDGITWT